MTLQIMWVMYLHDRLLLVQWVQPHRQSVSLLSDILTKPEYITLQFTFTNQCDVNGVSTPTLVWPPQNNPNSPQLAWVLSEIYTRLCGAIHQRRCNLGSESSMAEIYGSVNVHAVDHGS